MGDDILQVCQRLEFLAYAAVIDIALAAVWQIDVPARGPNVGNSIR